MADTLLIRNTFSVSCPAFSDISDEIVEEIADEVTIGLAAVSEHIREKYPIFGLEIDIDD